MRDGDRPGFTESGPFPSSYPTMSRRANGPPAASSRAAYAGIRGFLDLSQDPGVQRIMLLDGLSVLGWERVREIEAEYGLALIKTVIGTLVESGEIIPLRYSTNLHQPSLRW